MLAKDPDPGVDGRPRTFAGETMEVVTYLPGLIDRLPHVQRVLLLRIEAEEVWARTSRIAQTRSLAVKDCPRPSPLAFYEPVNQKLTCRGVRLGCGDVTTLTSLREHRTVRVACTSGPVLLAQGPCHNNRIDMGSLATSHWVYS